MSLVHPISIPVSARIGRSIRCALPPHVLIAVAAAVALAAAYLRWTPLSPDLAAQVARANVSRHVGSSSWWTGWFGGLSMPSYSVLVPSWMAVLGVQVTGVVAALAGALGGARLVRDTLRPRAAACAIAVSGGIDLIDGRVTFVTGAAIAVWSIIAIRSRRAVLGAALGAGAYFASPLAALFLGLVLVAIAWVDPSRRRAAAVGSATILLVATGMALLFPGTGTMPFSVLGAAIPALCCLGITAICKQPVVRATAVLTLLALPVFLLLPGAVGSNIGRLVWIGAAPVAIACTHLPRKLMILAAVILAAWPISDTIGQIHSADNPSAHAAFYQPLNTAIVQAERVAGAAAIGQRIEVVDPVNHWASVYVTGQSLARGWDRQADNADNPIFYQRGALTPASYHRWLEDLAVGWVALPSAPLDFASVAEAKLIRAGQSYLQLQWKTQNWSLYRVVASSPLAMGAEVQHVTDNAITLRTGGPGAVELRLRWSQYLAVVDPITRQTVPSCVLDKDGWVGLYLPAAETVAVTSSFTVASRLRSSDSDCIRDLESIQGT